MLIIATQRSSVFISEANVRIGVRCVALIAWKLLMVEVIMPAVTENQLRLLSSNYL